MGLNEVFAKIGEDMERIKTLFPKLWEHVVCKMDDLVAIWESKSQPATYKPSTLAELTMGFISIVQAMERRAKVEVTTSKVELVAKMAMARARELNAPNEEVNSLWEHRNFYFSREVDDTLAKLEQKTTASADADADAISNAVRRAFKKSVAPSTIFGTLVNKLVDETTSKERVREVASLVLSSIASEGFKANLSEKEMVASLKDAGLKDEVLKPFFTSADSESSLVARLNELF